MAITDEQRRQIFALKGQKGKDGKALTARAVAKIVGCDHKTVTSLWGSGEKTSHARATKRSGEKSGGKNSPLPTDSDTVIIEPDVIHARDEFMKAEAIRGEMVATLIVSKYAMNKSMDNVGANPTSNEDLRTLALLVKTTQAVIEDLAKWIGLDKGERQKDDAESEVADLFSEYAESS